MGVLESVPPASILLELLNAISDGVLVAGPDRRIVFCNAAFTRISGFSIEDMVGRSANLLQGPETNPATIAAIAARLDSGEAFHGEILNFRKSGEPFWCDMSICPVGDADGAVTHYIAIQRDITERRAAEAALRANAERHRYLFDHMLAGVVIHAADSRIVYANVTASRLLGVTQDSILGTFDTDPRWIFLRTDGEPMPIDEYPVNRANATRGEVKDMVVGIWRGSEIAVTWLMCSAFPILDEAGALVEIVVNFTDISDFRRAQQEVRQSEERLRLVLQGSQDAPWDLDFAADEAHYAPRWWQMLGYRENELPSTQSTWQGLVHPEEWPEVESRFAANLGGSAASYELEFRLRHKSGHYVPVLSRGFILRDEEGNPLRVSGVNTDLTERKRAEEKIHQLAFYDPLTNLPNRRLLMIQLRHALQRSVRSGHLGALLFIDLDHFKLLNDTLGHDKGDQLLQLVAVRLRETVRESDTVARLGGDEFVVMLEGLDDTQQSAALQAETVAHKLLDTCNRPYILDGARHRSTPSIGVALFDRGVPSVEELLKHADLAMYTAKATGRNSLRFFDSGMQIAVDRRMALEKDLSDGLDHGALSLHYQPQVNAAGQVIGAEALVRWEHPQQGMIPPNEFIPLAETTGLIHPLGRWVLRSACTTLHEWAGNPRLAWLTISVNVSIRQIHEPDFVQQVLMIIEETGAEPSLLKLELTESLLAENIESAIARMAELRAYGIGFVLDDFGTGYSSLAYLQRMPLDQLKIDKSFVADVLTSANDATIVRIIITLAEKLNLKVVAEGVETEGQKQFLIENGCTLFQGYLFGPAVPRERLEAAIL